MPPHVTNPEASKKFDPTVIGLWTVEPKSAINPTPFDFWKTVRRLYSEYLIDASRFNGNTSPLSAIWAATLRKIYYDKTLNVSMEDFKTLGWMSQVYSSRDGLGVAAKNMTFELRTLQSASQRVKDNIMDYAQFKTLALSYISKYFETKKQKFITKITLAQARKITAVACYTFIPPVRNSWSLMQIDTKPPTNADKKNVVIINPDGSITAYWNDFKNVSSFKNAPLVQHLDKSLSSIIQAYINLVKANDVKTKWLFPQQFSNESNSMSSKSFGDLLQESTAEFTGKRIGSSILRIMYISWYHEQGASVFNLADIHKTMALLHQSDLGVHLSYIKKLKTETPEERYKVMMDSMLREEEEAGDE